MIFRCPSCRAEREGATLSPTLDERYRTGRCDSSSCRGSSRTFVRVSGEEEKAIGQERAISASLSWSARARAWIEGRPPGAIYTSEDVTRELGLPPSSGAVGAVMTGAAKRGLHRKHEITKALRVNQHAAEIWRWIRT